MLMRFPSLWLPTVTEHVYLHVRDHHTLSTHCTAIHVSFRPNASHIASPDTIRFSIQLNFWGVWTRRIPMAMHDSCVYVRLSVLPSVLPSTPDSTTDAAYISYDVLPPPELINPSPLP